MTCGAIVVTVWSGISPPSPRLMRNSAVTVPDGEPPLCRVGLSRMFPAGITEVTAGRSAGSDVPVDEDTLSRSALRLVQFRGGWTAELRNRRGTEYRTWGQGVQPLLGVGESPSTPRPATVPLRGGQHAFLFKCGQFNERTVCISVEMRDGEADGDSVEAATSTTLVDDAQITPRKLLTHPPSAEAIDKFRQIYWQFLVWPPRLQPEPVSPTSFKVQASDAHARIVRYVTQFGYTLPARPHAPQDVLPAQLIEIELLRFEDHALWRDQNGHISPFLTDTERFRIKQLGARTQTQT